MTDEPMTPERAFERRMLAKLGKKARKLSNDIGLTTANRAEFSEIADEVLLVLNGTHEDMKEVSHD